MPRAETCTGGGEVVLVLTLYLLETEKKALREEGVLEFDIMGERYVGFLSLLTSCENIHVYLYST